MGLSCFFPKRTVVVSKCTVHCTVSVQAQASPPPSVQQNRQNTGLVMSDMALGPGSHFTAFTVHCQTNSAVYSAQWNRVQCRVYSVKCTLYSVQCRVKNAQYRVGSWWPPGGLLTASGRRSQEVLATPPPPHTRKEVYNAVHCSFLQFSLVHSSAL